MNDTPRTSEEWKRLQRNEFGEYSEDVTYGELAHGMSKFAKKLELEIAEVIKERDSLKTQLAEAQQQRDEWFEVYTQTLKKLGDAREQIAKLITDA